MTTTWIIDWMQTTPSSANPSNCVQTVSWRAKGIQNEHSSTIYGTVGLPEPGSPFIPYQNLTEQTVLNWVWNNGVDKTNVEQALQQQIDSKINPTIVTPQLPW